jgi:diguanylate cyclase (GGDEF)-like protein
MDLTAADATTLESGRQPHFRRSGSRMDMDELVDVLEHALARSALSDELTGLANRSLLLDRLGAATGRRAPVAVLFIDLDGFKLINDGFGHETGDRLLVDVAARLRDAVRPSDLVARMGGDEFAVLCEPVDGERDALAVARRIQARLAEPFAIAGQRRQVRASIGCRYTEPGGDDGETGAGPEALLRDADVAMYQAKAAGKNRVEPYSAATRARILRRLELEHELRRAVGGRELAVHYQPQVDLVTGRLVGVEALVRWPHSRFGAVSPEEFVSVAEETGLIAPLGAWVFDEACRQLAAWRRLPELAGLTVTVNVSVHQLEDPRFALQVAGSLEVSGVPASSVCLELTESALMAAGGGPLEVLEALKAHGVYVAVDDFGTGYSSLASLKRLPVEVLKVDRSFVGGLGTDPEDSAIVASVLSLAHAMGLHVVAEGVETALQAAELLALGCTVAQGWLFSPAVPAEDLAALSRGMRRRFNLARPAPELARRAAKRGLIDEMMDQVGIPGEAP